MVLHCQWGICTGDVRYPDRICGSKIHRFPKPEAECLAWIKACGRPHEQLNLCRINKNKGVCAGHFVGGNGPTASHPYPAQADRIRVRKARPTRKRASESESRQDGQDKRPWIGAGSLDPYDAAVNNDADKGIEVQTDEQWISPLDMLALTAELEMAKTEISRLQAKVEHLETDLQKEKRAVQQEQERKQFACRLQDVYKEELCKQERRSTLDQEAFEPLQVKKEEEPEDQHIKEEQEDLEYQQIKVEEIEVSCSQGEEQLELKQETDTYHEQMYHTKSEPNWIQVIFQGAAETEN
ncbi:nucleolar protein 58-like [Xiphophorus maculatus]|uniref:nucleolar protein 58-like n=1 Tax=Xiphophorus maculatus TaxID=8083 RepID=UPI000C6DA13F|nr:nucleolar protein 58-like [Xiphophorus maculatus]